jgi:hypothetical protein
VLQLGDDLAGDVVVEVRPVATGTGMGGGSGYRGSPRRAVRASLSPRQPVTATAASLYLFRAPPAGQLLCGSVGLVVVFVASALRRTSSSWSAPWGRHPDGVRRCGAKKKGVLARAKLTGRASAHPTDRCR